MSRSELHGIVTSLRSYLDYEESLDSIGYAEDPELEAAWTNYQQESLKRALSSVTAQKLSHPESPRQLTPAANVSSFVQNQRQQGVPAKTAHPKTPDSSTEFDEQALWRKMGVVTTKSLREAALAHHRMYALPRSDSSPIYQQVTDPSARQGRPVSPPQTSRQINLDRAAHTHEQMLARSPYGWIEGRFWLAPEEPPGGFSKDEQLDLIRTYTSQCYRCGLCRNRRTVVCEDGSPDGRVMFIGEGPGRDEDEMGIPFVGKAGQLLSDMIAAMGLDRQRDVYIANVVKCRPENNRDPNEEEIRKCISFLWRQIDAVAPKVIVTLGKISMNALFPNGEKSIVKARGKWRSYTTPGGLEVPVMPTFHPSYVLRTRETDRSVRAAVWKDLQAVMALLKNNELQ